MEGRNPVHQDAVDGKWYYWIETWADRNGPYETEADAQQGLDTYCRVFLAVPVGLIAIPAEVFTHVAPDGTVRHFDVRPMMDYAMSWLVPFSRGDVPAITPPEVELLQAVIDDEFILHIKTHRGVEDARVRSMPEDQLWMPALAVLFEDGATLTVDGHHRMVRWAERGDTSYKLFRFKPGTWEKYLLDLPPDVSATVAEDVMGKGGA